MFLYLHICVPISPSWWTQHKTPALWEEKCNFVCPLSEHHFFPRVFLTSECPPAPRSCPAQRFFFQVSLSGGGSGPPPGSLKKPLPLPSQEGGAVDRQPDVPVRDAHRRDACVPGGGQAAVEGRFPHPRVGRQRGGKGTFHLPGRCRGVGVAICTPVLLSCQRRWVLTNEPFQEELPGSARAGGGVPAKYYPKSTPQSNCPDLLGK